MSAVDSRRTAVRANLEKLLLLAALTPFVVSGIAQRASLLGEDGAAAGIVAATVSTGAVCAVIGALGFGWAADRGRDPVGRRWYWVLLAVLVGTAGLFVAMIPALPALVGGWAAAQLGYSGAMALLRAALATAGAAHRRRGSVAMVLGAYLGIFLPVLLLIALPGSGWVLSGALAVLCLGYAALIAARVHRARGPGAAISGEAPRPAAAPSRSPEAPQRRPAIGAATLLLVQCLSAIVVAAFLSYHPLDLEQRLGVSGDATVRTSALVLAAALAGLIAAGLALLARPQWLGSPRALLVGAALLLACSIGLRAGAGSLPPVAAAALLSGAAVGITNATLLAAALETAPPERTGRFIGAFSAAGALGQVVGPVLALALMRAAPEGFAPLGFLMLCLAAAPAGWAALLLASGRSGSGSRPGRADPGPR